MSPCSFGYISVIFQLPPINLETQTSQTQLTDDFPQSPLDTPSPRPQANLVRGGSQVYPADSKDIEVNNDRSTTPVKSESCAKTTGRVLAALLLGMVFGWMLQKSSGKLRLLIFSCLGHLYLLYW